MGIIKKQGIRNSIITYIGIAIGFINLIFLQPFFLSSEEIGLTRILLNTSYLISCFISLGVGNVNSRYFPVFKNESNGHHGFLGFLSLFMVVGSVLATILLYFFRASLISQYQKSSPLFVEYFDLILPFSILLAFGALINLYSFSLYKTVFPSFINEIFIRIITITLFGIYFIKLISLDTMIILYILIYAFVLIVMIAYLIKHKAFKLKIDVGFLKKQDLTAIIRYALTFAMVPIASYGIRFMDGILMGKYLNLAAVGIYSIMSFIPSFIEAPLLALEKIANPKIAEAITRNDIDEIKSIYYKSCRYMMFIAGLLLILIYTNASYLVSFLKPEYMQGINVVYIISLSAAFNLYTGTNNAIVYNSTNYIFGTVLLVIIMCITVGLNILLIPILGMEGAAIATMIAGLVFNFTKWIFIKIKFGYQPYDLRNLLIALSTFLTISLLIVLPEASNIYWSAIYKTCLLSSIYIFFNYITKTITLSEIKK